MVVQYPHFIKITSAPGATQDANGDMTSSGSDYQAQLRGRAEPNSEGEYIQTDDGSRHLYTWCIYLPLTAIPDLRPGSKVEIGLTNSVSPDYTGKIARFSRGQLNMRIWV